MNAGGSFKDVGVDWTLQLLSQLGAGGFYVMLLCNFTDSVYWVFNISQKLMKLKIKDLSKSVLFPSYRWT